MLYCICGILIIIYRVHLNRVKRQIRISYALMPFIMLTDGQTAPGLREITAYFHIMRPAHNG